MLDRDTWENQPLGKMPDAWIAKDLGVSREAVRRQRVKRGIGYYYGPHSDLRNKRFGKLLVHDWCMEDGNVMWICDCDCGEFSVLVPNAGIRSRSSCGCARRRKPMPIGTRFGRLKVIGEGTRTDHRGLMRYTECKCDCGVIKEYLDSNLKNGLSKSCGCFNRDLQSTKNISGMARTDTLSDKFKDCVLNHRIGCGDDRYGGVKDDR